MFGYNYNTPGKGVNKRDPNQPRISIFFELLFRKLWNLCKVNLFYILTAIPTLLVTMVVVGILSSRVTEVAIPFVAGALELPPDDLSNPLMVSMVAKFDVFMRMVFAFLFLVFLGQGPVTAGITYILRNYAREDHAWFFSDWWKNTRTNFRQALIVWVVDLAAFCIFTVSIGIYLTIGGAISYLAGVVIAVCLIYLMMHFYIYQLMITFENSLVAIFRNAFVLAMQRLPRNLLMLLILLAVHIGLPIVGIMAGWKGITWILFLGAEVLILVAASGFMTNFFIYPQLERYIKESKQENVTEEQWLQ